MGFIDLRDSRCVPIVFVMALQFCFIKHVCLSDFPFLDFFYDRSREVPCISLLVAACFVLNVICLLEYFSNMEVMVEIVSCRVEFFWALSVFCVRALFLAAKLRLLQTFAGLLFAEFLFFDQNKVNYLKLTFQKR